MIIIPWMEVTLALAIGLVSLFASGCAPSEPLPTIGPEKVALHTIEVTPSPEPTGKSLPTPTATPLPTPTQLPPTVTPSPISTTPPPTATQMPSPTAAASPSSVTPSPIPSPEPTPTEAPTGVTITILYDNNKYDERLKTAWGFSCLVERGDLTLLFDTGGDAPMLLSNMATLGLDPAKVDIIVLSHVHGDHVGGLGGILAVNKETTVYLPHSFPASLKAEVKVHAHLVEVQGPLEIAEGIYTTGELGAGIIEQSLVLVTKQGLVLITGCAHPGIVSIVTKAKEITGGEVYLVMGGFHLGGVSEAAIEGIIEDFQRLEVQKVAPCHCSGDLARSIFEEAYGEGFIRAGVGSKLKVGG